MDKMNYLKLIPYLIIIILLAVIGYLQYTFHKNIISVQSQLNESHKSFAEYQLKQKENQLLIITAINDANNKRVSELNDAINKINVITNNNRTAINELRQETATAETNYNNLSEATRKHYTETVNRLFNESAELLVEFSAAADKSTAAAITYHGMLNDQYEIVNKYNEEIVNK